MKEREYRFLLFALGWDLKRRYPSLSREARRAPVHPRSLALRISRRIWPNFGQILGFPLVTFTEIFNQLLLAPLAVNCDHVYERAPHYPWNVPCSTHPHLPPSLSPLTGEGFPTPLGVPWVSLSIPLFPGPPASPTPPPVYDGYPSASSPSQYPWR